MDLFFSNIQKKLFREIITTPSATLTGTLIETQMTPAIPIPAGTLTNSELLRIISAFVRNTGGSNAVVLRFKMSTSNTMPSGTTGQFATAQLGVSNQFLGFERNNLKINGGNLSGISNVSNQFSDNGALNIAQSSQPFDETVNNYLYVSGTLGNIGDSLTMLSFGAYN